MKKISIVTLLVSRVFLMIKSVYIFYGGFEKNAGGAFLHAKTLNKYLLNKNVSSKIVTLDDLPIIFRYLPHLAFYFCLYCFPHYAFHLKGNITGYLYKKFFEPKADANIFEDIYIAWKSEKPALTILHAAWSDNLYSFSFSEKAQKKLRRLEEKTILIKSTSVFTVSEEYREYLIKDHFNNIKFEDIGVIPLGRDLPRNMKFETEFLKNKKSIVAMGLLEKRKNFRFLLRVFKAVYAKDKDYKLTILGADGGELNDLKHYASNNKLPVFFLGKLGYQDTLQELSKHHIYLHTSAKESFSYSLLEAKLLSCVTIALDELQVPREFIDIKLPAFDFNLWSEAVMDASGLSCEFKNSFSVEKMGKLTIDYLSRG